MWQLQIESGRIIGPLTTEQVLFRIREGLITGQEKLRTYPDGQWIPVSREPTFYDELLKSLENSVKRTQNEDATQIRRPVDNPNDPDRTQIRPATADKSEKLEPPKPEPVSSPLVSKGNETYNPKIDRLVAKTNPSKVQPPALPLSPGGPLPRPPTTAAEKKGSLLRLFLFAAIIGVVGLLVVVGLGPQTSSVERFGLLQPKPGIKTTLSEGDQAKMLKEIFGLVFKDTVEDYFRAQLLTTKLIAGAPNLTDPRGLLCIEQYHMWPFVEQTSQEYEILQSARRSARMMDPRGLDGLHCEISYLMMMGKYRDAMGIIDHTAGRREVPDSPVLDSMKAEILAADKNFKDAILWAKEAEKLWPGWAYPIYQQGLYQAESAQSDAAIETFQKVLARNPHHRASMFELGILISQSGRDLPVAEKFLLAAAKESGRVPHSREARAYFNLAKIKADKKDRSAALQWAQKAYQLNPSDLKIRDFFIQLGGNPTAVATTQKNNELVFAGDQQYRSGDYLFAQAEYKTAFEQDPTNALAATKAARCLWNLAQTREALEWLKKAMAADPKLSLPYYLYADYQSQLFNFPAAAEVLQKASLKIPNHPEILRGFGLVEIRRNNPKDAIMFLERAFKIYDNDEDTLILLAKAYMMTGTGDDLQKALNMATRAIQIEDTNPEAQVIYAKVLAAAKGADAGVNYMKELVEKYSYTMEFRLGLAEILKTAERYKDAQDEYERLVLMDEKNKKAFMGLAECYQAQGYLEKALKKYLTAAILDPADPEPMFKAGNVYMEAGRYKDAVAQFQRGLSVSPVYPRGNYMLGQAGMAMKDFAGALQAAQAERRNNPNIADSYLLAGQVYLETRDYQKCANEYRIAVRFRPKGAENYVKLALCEELSGNLEIAESVLTVALNQESGYAEIYKVQGNILEKKGENPAAVVSYNKYLLLAPNASDRKEIEFRIQRLGGSVDQ